MSEVYRVTWTLEIRASSPHEAACFMWEAMDQADDIVKVMRVTSSDTAVNVVLHPLDGDADDAAVTRAVQIYEHDDVSAPRLQLSYNSQPATETGTQSAGYGRSISS